VRPTIAAVGLCGRISCPADHLGMLEALRTHCVRSVFSVDQIRSTSQRSRYMVRLLHVLHRLPNTAFAASTI